MSRRHLLFLLVEQGLAPALFNVALNAGIAWLAYRSLTLVPLWGTQSIAIDTIVTGFLLPFLTCLLSTVAIRRKVRDGKLPPLEKRRGLARLPPGTFRRSVALGLLGVALSAPTLFVLERTGADPLSFQQFVVFKALYAGLLASFFSPVIALCALSDFPPGAEGSCGIRPA